MLEFWQLNYQWGCFGSLEIMVVKIKPVNTTVLRIFTTFTFCVVVIRVCESLSFMLNCWILVVKLYFNETNGTTMDNNVAILAVKLPYREKSSYWNQYLKYLVTVVIFTRIFWVGAGFFVVVKNQWFPLFSNCYSKI